MDKEMDLGSCCACGKKRPFTRNLMCLDFEAPIVGSGWGCIKCSLPQNGAMAVVCDECLESNQEIVFVILGVPMERRRLSVDGFEKRPFHHDLSKHPELFPANGMTNQIHWFTDSPDIGSPSCLCSWCGLPIQDNDEIPIRAWKNGSNGVLLESRFHSPNCINSAYGYELVMAG